jgi:hypothetical protein
VSQAGWLMDRRSSVAATRCSSLRPSSGCEKAGRQSLCRGWLSGESWQSLAKSAALLVRKEDTAVDRLASEALAVASSVDSLQSCPLDVSVAVAD